VNDRRRAFKKFISLPFFISLKTQQNCESWNLFEPCLSGCSFVWAFLLSLSYSSSSFSSSSAAFGGSSNFGRFSDFRGGERETKSSNKIRGGSNGAVNYGTQEEATVPIFFFLSKLVFHHLLATNRG